MKKKSGLAIGLTSIFSLLSIPAFAMKKSHHIFNPYMRMDYKAVDSDNLADRKPFNQFIATHVRLDFKGPTEIKNQTYRVRLRANKSFTQRSGTGLHQGVE